MRVTASDDLFASFSLTAWCGDKAPGSREFELAAEQYVYLRPNRLGREDQLPWRRMETVSSALLNMVLPATVDNRNATGRLRGRLRETLEEGFEVLFTVFIYELQ